MKKLIILIIICFTFIGCSLLDLRVEQSNEGVINYLPPGSMNLKNTDKDCWYSFTRNNNKYLIFYYPCGLYSKSIVIMEDK